MSALHGDMSSIEEAMQPTAACTAATHGVLAFYFLLLFFLAATTNQQLHKNSFEQ